MNQKTDRELFEEWAIQRFSASPPAFIKEGGEYVNHRIGDMCEAFQAGRASLPASDWDDAIDEVILLVGQYADTEPIREVYQQIRDLKRQPSEVSEQPQGDALIENLHTAKQAFLEFHHAINVGPGWWYKGGKSAMYAHVLMWVRRGESAVNSAIDNLKRQP